MQKFEKAIQFGSEIKFSLDGDCVVNFIESNDENDFVRVSYFLDSNKITIDVAENHMIIMDKGKVGVNDADFGNFKDSIVGNKGVVSAVLNFLSDALSFKDKIKANKREIFVEIYLRSAEEKKSINLNAENLKIDFSCIACNDVFIRSGNLVINQGGLTSNTLKIKSGNLKADLFFNEENRKINIKSSNAKVHLNKRKNFNGLVTASGNNVKFDNSLCSGVKDVGEFNAKLNNGSIKLVEI